jgi:hypothetical protein
MVGNVVGGLVPAIVSGGTSLAPKVGATIGQKIASAATAGALSGAVSGAGTSESADLTGMAQDALMGAVGGGVLGGAAGVGGKVAATTIGAGIGASLSPEDPLTGAAIVGGGALAGKTAFDAMKTSDPAKIISKLFKKGAQGTDLRSSDSDQVLKSRYVDVSNEVESAAKAAVKPAIELQAELLNKGSDVPIREWYNHAKAVIKAGREQYKSPKAQEEFDYLEKIIDAHVLKNPELIDVPIMETSDKIQREIKVLETKLEQLNLKEHAKREAQAEIKPYRAAGQGGELQTPDETPYEYLSKAGVLQKAKALKRNPETGELMPTLGDTELNAAFGDIAQTNINAPLPFEKKQVTLNGKLYEIIIDTRTGKPMSAAMEIKSPDTLVEGVKSVPVSFPEETLSTNKINFLKQDIGVLGSAGEESTRLSHKGPRGVVDRLLTQFDEDRTPSASELKMGFTKTSPVLKSLEEQGGGAELAQVNAYLSQLRDVEKKAPELLTIMRTAKNSDTSMEAYKTVTQYKEALQKLKNTTNNPELKSRINVLEKVLEKADELAEDTMLHKEVHARGLSQDMKQPQNWLASSGRGVVYGGANWAGLQTKAAKDTVTAVGKKLYEMTPETLQNTATKISQRFKDSPTAQKFAQQLSMASGKDHIKRNALLFTLQQNPAYREFIQQLGDDDGQ